MANSNMQIDASACVGAGRQASCTVTTFATEGLDRLRPRPGFALMPPSPSHILLPAATARRLLPGPQAASFVVLCSVKARSGSG